MILNAKINKSYRNVSVSGISEVVGSLLGGGNILISIMSFYYIDKSTGSEKSCVCSQENPAILDLGDDRLYASLNIPDSEALAFRHRVLTHSESGEVFEFVVDRNVKFTGEEPININSKDYVKKVM